MTKIFDSSGIVTTSIEYDEPEDRYIIGSHQNVAPIMDDIRARNNDGSGGWGASRELRHRARIPAALYDEWLREAYRQNRPIYHKRERDKWLKAKLAEYDGLRIRAR